MRPLLAPSVLAPVLAPVMASVLASMLASVLVVASVPGCARRDAVANQHQQPPLLPWPTAGWLESTPAAQGLDQAALESLDAQLAAGAHGYVDSLLVVRNGQVVFERSYQHDYQQLFETAPDRRFALYNYYDPTWHPYYQGGPLHTLQSVSKSVTSALVGIALARGQIGSIDDPVLQFLPTRGNAGAGEGWQRMTLRHVLTMTTGIRWDESTIAYTDPRNSCAAMEASEDWIGYVLAQEVVDDPGTRFVYNSGATQLLSQVLHTATGEHAHDYAARHLFAPLGIERFFWKQTPLGLADTEGGLYLAPRDLAKIGYLYLHDGVWDNTRILPAGWVAASTEPLVDPRIEGVPRRYGFQWWLIPHDEAAAYAWAALGYGGQYLLVVPERALVVVVNAWNIWDRPTLPATLVLERVLAAITES